MWGIDRTKGLACLPASPPSLLPKKRCYARGSNLNAFGAEVLRRVDADFYRANFHFATNDEHDDEQYANSICLHRLDLMIRSCLTHT